MIDKNVNSRFGEIDIIMKDKNCIIFIEVRYRKFKTYGDAKSTITCSKKKKIIKSALLWMSNFNINIENTEFRFDVIAIDNDKIEWIKDAFNE